MVRADRIAVAPLRHAIGTLVQAVERADVDTVMVGGRLRKRAGKLLDIDVAKLIEEAIASRDYLLGASGYRVGMFDSAATPPASAA